MTYLGDIALGDTIDLKFATVNTSGVPTTLAGTPVISAYPGNSTTQLTAGITLTVDFDSVTGMHNVRVVATSGNGYATATNYALVITTGTVGGSSVVGYVIGHFSIEARSALRPTVAARTLDVSAAGEAGVDWANVGSPTTALNLSGTTVATSQVVASVTGAVGSVTAGVTVTTNNDKTGYALSAGGVTAVQSGLATSSALATVQADTDDIQTRLPAALVSGRMDSSVGAMAANTLTASALATDAVTEIQTGLATPTNITAGTITNVTTVNGLAANVITAASMAADASAEIADAVWDELIAGHLGAGSTGAALNSAGSAGDPWGTGLPGAYGAGSAGFIIGTNLNATISSRASASALATVQSDTDDIQSRLPAALVSGRMDASVGAMAADTLTATAVAASAVTEIQSGLSTVTTAQVKAQADQALADVGLTATITGRVDAAISTRLASASYVAPDNATITAINAKTTNLPASPAAVGSAMTLTSGERTSIADALLTRDWTAVSGIASRSVLNALRAIRNRVAVAAGTMTVYQEDDASSAWTAVVTTDASADPVTQVDPT
jgi:hypothetical protein